MIVEYNDKWPFDNFVWSKGLVKLSPKLRSRNLFVVILAYANGIGAEVLPDGSIKPSALSIATS